MKLDLEGIDQKQARLSQTTRVATYHREMTNARALLGRELALRRGSNSGAKKQPSRN